MKTTANWRTQRLRKDDGLNLTRYLNSFASLLVWFKGNEPIQAELTLSSATSTTYRWGLRSQQIVKYTSYEAKPFTDGQPLMGKDNFTYEDSRLLAREPFLEEIPFELNELMQKFVTLSEQ